METSFSLCALRVFSEAGGEKHSLTYPLSKAGTISIAEGLRRELNRDIQYPETSIPYPAFYRMPMVFARGIHWERRSEARRERLSTEKG